MRFWDASAVVPLFLRESSSLQLRELAGLDPEMTVWWGTRVECASALFRRHREAPLGQAGRTESSHRLEVLASAWVEIEPSEVIRDEAERLVARYPLSAADAFQLAAALAWCGNHPSGAEFVCLDNRLREAALLEGFVVEPPR